MTRVLFVCTGSICRSPSAEGVFRAVAAREGLADRVQVASAGTHDYHVGAAPDRRAQAAARTRGYDLSAQCARQVTEDDFRRFDYVLAMDKGHLEWLRRRCPVGYGDRIRLFLSFAGDSQIDEVPDPYYGGDEGFEHVLDLVENASEGLLAEIRAGA